MNLQLVPVAILLIALMVGGGYYKGHSSGVKQGEAAVQSKWDAEKARVAKAISDELTRARSKEAELQAAADQERRKKDAEISTLNARNAALLSSLRNRPQRPSSQDVPKNSDTGSVASGCTGARLYREDGQFLAGEAAAGKLCQIHLAKCRADLDQAVNSQNKD